MITFLLGVPGRLKAVKDALDAGITSLTAAIATTAPATSALDKAVWTDTLATDLIAALPNLPRGIINRIQTGYIRGTGSTSSFEDWTYVDTTITAVNTAKSIVLLQPGAGGTVNYYTGRLTSSTNVRVSADNSGSNIHCRWYVIEFK